MKSRLFIILALLAGCMTINAKVALPQVFGDNMVLQQSTNVKLWGTANKNSLVNIKCSWTNKSFSAKSDNNGKWMAYITTPKASYNPQSITINDGTTPIKVQNILIGEVWLCSGQSNMEITMNGYWNCPIKNANEIIANAGQYKGIRCGVIPITTAVTPQDTCKCKWYVSNSKNAPLFSATAFNYAIMLNKVLDVPVGILVSSFGGSMVEGWLPEKILKGYSDVDLRQKDDAKTFIALRPEVMYNGMLHPIVGYTIKGIIWYQGESNVRHHDTYHDRLTTMVKEWRDEWGLGKIPFYFVEIAPYQYGDGDYAAYLRESQFKASKMIENSGIVCTNDLVEPYEEVNIHPKDKTGVGYRLAYYALANTYGMQGIEPYSPSYKSMKVDGDKVILTFDHAQDGFNRTIGMDGFEVAGADKIFYPATGKITQNRLIEVSAKEVPVPVAVRYCFHNFKLGNVANTRGLPLFPFRTDNW